MKNLLPATHQVFVEEDGQLKPVSPIMIEDAARMVCQSVIAGKAMGMHRDWKDPHVVRVISIQRN